MNCLKKNFIRIQTLLLTIVFLCSFSSGIKADYTSVSLSPSSGTVFSDNTAIKVLVNSGTDEFIGMDIFLSFTGPVQFVSATGVDRCSSFRVIDRSGSINIECFSLSHEVGETFDGVLATLNFKSTGVGSSTFTIMTTDPATTSKSGGVYTLSVEQSETDSVEQSETETLPDAGLFDDSRFVILGGLGLIVLGTLFSRIADFFISIANNLNSFFTIKNNVIGKKTKRRRGRFEKKF